VQEQSAANMVDTPRQTIAEPKQLREQIRLEAGVTLPSSHRKTMQHIGHEFVRFEWLHMVRRNHALIELLQFR